MLERFEKDDRAYLDWVRGNQLGFVVNTDQDHVSPDYPMLHKASHGLISSPSRENYTNNRFFKVCSDNVEELESWSRAERGRSLTRCKTCKP
jgi:hypothetical protein